MKLSLLYRCIITDKNGKIVKRTHWRKSRSFVIQFLQHIDVCINNAHDANGATVSIRDVDNVLRNIQAVGTVTLITFFSVFAGDNDDTYGIQVGTGTTAPTNTDYKLTTKIAHGIGAGQLDYGTHSRTASTVVGANVDFIISRAFYNGSGEPITVNEIGVVCNSEDTASNQYMFLLIRDVITAITTANTQTLTVQYTFRTTV